MIRPTPRALLLLGCGLPLAALPTVLGAAGLWWPWIAYVAACAGLLLLEFALLVPRRAVQLDVDVPFVVPFGHDLELLFEARSPRAITCELLVETEGDVAPLPTVGLRVPADEPVRARLPMRPRRRGVVRLLATHLRWAGPLGLLWSERTQRFDCDVQVAVDVGSVREKASRMVGNREFQRGLKVERYLGDGTEFESLREYVQGMDHRSIDWKATARLRQVVSREFRAERARSVMLCIDSGRLMGEPLGGKPRLDHAILAALQLAFVSLRTGDRVGLFSFAEQKRQVLLPRAGVHQMEAIQAQLVELDYSEQETNFTRSMTELLQQLRRRTMLVLFTDFVDSVTAELMMRNLNWLTKRHLLLFVALRDPLLDELIDGEPSAVEDVTRSVVADEIVRERRVVLERIRQSGAQVLDVEVERLEPELIERYLSMKRRELL